MSTMSTTDDGVTISNEGQYPSGDVHARLAWIMARVPVIEKTRMPNVSYTAFAIDTVYTQLRGLFADAGVYVMPKLKDISYEAGTGTNRSGKAYAFTDVRLVMEYRFTAEDGTTDSMVVPGEARDSGDKGTFQATQQAIKYGFVQAFMIATGEPDPDSGKPHSEDVVELDAHDTAWNHVYGLFGKDDASERWFTIFDSLGLDPEKRLTTPTARTVMQAADQLHTEEGDTE